MIFGKKRPLVKRKFAQKKNEILVFCFSLFYDFYFSLLLSPSSTKQLDNFEIKPGKCLKINVSVPNLRLFVGNIPKSKGKEEILDEFGKLTGNWKKNKKVNESK